MSGPEIMRAIEVLLDEQAQLSRELAQLSAEMRALGAALESSVMQAEADRQVTYALMSDLRDFAEQVSTHTVTLVLTMERCLVPQGEKRGKKN
jgi:hypothetical protein